MKRRNFKNSLVLDQQRAKELASKRAEVKARRALQSNGGNGNGQMGTTNLQPERKHGVGERDV